ncbi:tRNA preQ1(34) S-adenosylmethionine ribosyltransferase-isomerase QueA [Chloroflexota bacterium]
MKTSDFDYDLAPRFIAQTAVEPRDHSRLMILRRHEELFENRKFYELADYLESGDILVCNNTRVIPARLWGNKVGSGGKVELLLLKRKEHGIWETLAKPGRRLKEGTKIEIESNSHLEAQVLAKKEGGIVIVSLSNEEALESAGVVPLPPYISTPLSDTKRYQTVYAQENGSVAAPTAGLHFTPRLMGQLRKKGVRFAFVTLHLGLDSFRPLQVDNPREHVLHKEYYELGSKTADEINQARAEGRRVICVGTSSVRVLEQVAQVNNGSLKSSSGWADLFIIPGHHYQMVDAMITNFHLPRSSLLMLVSAFAGREFVLKAYSEAIKLNYRFYSFGDAMLIT